MSSNERAIRFIDSDYRELFRIPDGASINIIYPPGDGRGTITRACDFLDDHHTSIGGNVYHICEFAERMERLGARYEPEEQLRGVELSPFKAGEERFYTYNHEEDNACIGHISGDFGRQGDRFHHNWSERDTGRDTPEFHAELHSAIYALRQGILKDHASMVEFCQSHPEAKLPDRAGFEHYGFQLDTASRQYFILCIAERESRFVVYAYDKAVPEKAKYAEGLPEYCFGKLEADGEIVRIVRGESGYYRIAPQPASPFIELNAGIGVSKAQADAMLIGSMFGWDKPGADPSRYDADGRPSPVPKRRSSQMER